MYLAIRFDVESAESADESVIGEESEDTLRHILFDCQALQATSFKWKYEMARLGKPCSKVEDFCRSLRLPA
jgi:hypothetical protein